MQYQIQKSACNKNGSLVIIQEQGESAPTIINLPYDITDVDFQGTVNFPTPISLEIDDGITVDSIVSVVGSILNTTLTITAINNGAIFVGMPVNGTGVAPGTYVATFGTGTGGTGTYILNQGQNVTSTTFANSRISMQLAPEQTQDIKEGQYAFDLWSIVTGTPNVNTNILNGFFTINEALTRVT